MELGAVLGLAPDPVKLFKPCQQGNRMLNDGGGVDDDDNDNNDLS